MIIHSSIWKVAQILLNIWLQKNTVTKWNDISHKSAVTYVEGIQALRSAVFLFSILLLCIIFLTAGVAILIQGILTLQPLTAEGLAWLQIGIGSAAVLIVAVGIWRVMSESLWIRVFKIDQIVNHQKPKIVYQAK